MTFEVDDDDDDTDTDTDTDNDSDTDNDNTTQKLAERRPGELVRVGCEPTLGPLSAPS